MSGKRAATISGHKTSIFVEDAFWQEFKAIAQAKSLPIGELVEQQKGEAPNLSSAIQVYILEQVQTGARLAQVAAKLRLVAGSADGDDRHTALSHTVSEHSEA